MDLISSFFGLLSELRGVMPAFLLASVLITVAPGPDNMQVLAIGLHRGRSAALLATAGFIGGLLFHILVVSISATLFLEDNSTLMAAVRYLGALYLIWIGVRIICTEEKRAEVESPLRPARLFVRCMLCNMSNPKVAAFFLLYLPQFVPAAISHTSGAVLMLGLAFAMQTAVVFSAIAMMADKCREWAARRPAASVVISKASGVVCVAIGLASFWQ